MNDFYVYHGIPHNMIGTNLVPLNKMGEELKEVKALHLSKYEGREEVLNRRIELLDCLWNDVVQFLPMDPQKVFEKQVELGLIPSVPPYKFFKIPVSLLDPNKTVVFFKTAPGEENVTTKWLTDVNFEELSEIPPATIAYYETLTGTGELPFNYQFIPHVVSMDEIDVSGAQIVTLK